MKVFFILLLLVSCGKKKEKDDPSWCSQNKNRVLENLRLGDNISENIDAQKVISQCHSKTYNYQWSGYCSKSYSFWDGNMNNYYNIDTDCSTSHVESIFTSN